MTEHFPRERLQNLAKPGAERRITSRQPRLEMRWVVDPETSRPVVLWASAEDARVFHVLRAS
jgi:hypothetical protein